MTGNEERSLAGIAHFATLDAPALRRLEAHCRWRHCSKGQQVIAAGSESREVYFIMRGTLEVINVSSAGREIAYATLGPGDCFGELSAIDGQPRSAGVVAAEDCLLAELPTARFLELLQTRAEVTFLLLQHLSRQVRSGDLRIMELSSLAVSDRVYRELLRMAQPDVALVGRWVVRPLPPLRQIASRVSTSRETVARVMAQLYQSGLVRRKGRMLYLLDRDKLAALTGSSVAGGAG